VRPLLAIVLAALSLCAAHAEPPARVESPSAPGKRIVWLDVVRERVPLLPHARGKRWPLITWEGFGLAPLPPGELRALLARGLTQHLAFEARHVAAARRLREAGSPVILMDGRGGNWPARLAGEEAAWAHRFERGYEMPGPWIGACPMMRGGWAALGDEVRRTLGAYRDARVRVDAVWADWESDPLFWPHLFEQQRHCLRCRAQLDPAVLADRRVWGDFSWRLYLDLFGAYLAAPALEIFPELSVTNWMAVHSTEQRPVRTWGDHVLPPSAPPLFTATNPVAYGNTEFFAKAWDESWPLERLWVDRFYTHLMLRQLSADEANRRERAPGLESIVWVARWVPDDRDPEIPVMSREAYRESLRHLWLRGADAMAVFNHVQPGYEEMAVLEVVDAAEVYGEMLAFREFLDAGEVLHTEIPERQHDGVLWSGLRLGDRALVRATSQSARDQTVVLEPWPGERIAVGAPRAGRTWILERGAAAPRAVSP
jgi:hypothetical protein